MVFETIVSYWFPMSIATIWWRYTIALLSIIIRVTCVVRLITVFVYQRQIKTLKCSLHKHTGLIPSSDVHLCKWSQKKQTTHTIVSIKHVQKHVSRSLSIVSTRYNFLLNTSGSREGVVIVCKRTKIAAIKECKRIRTLKRISLQKLLILFTCLSLTHVLVFG